MTSRLAWAAAAALALAPAAARASVFDVEGFGPAGVAEVGARAARADDGTATFYGPGGLALGSGVRVELAPTLGVSNLAAQHKTLTLEDPFGVALAFDATIPFDGVLKDRIRFGFGSYLLPTNALRVLAHPEDQPFYPYFDNRTQRLVVLPALAVKIARGLGVGVGVNVLGGVSGPASVTTGASGAPEPRIDVEATTRLSAVVGVRFDPVDRVHLAATFRQKFSVPSRVDTSADVGGVPLVVSVNAPENLFDPDTFVLAAGFDFGRLSVELDASYAVWSAFDGPFVDVHAELPGVNIDANLPGALTRDVVGVRAAADYRVDVGAHRLVLRAGAGFEPTMLRDVQQGTTNLLDGNKVLLGTGASLELAHVVGRALRVGAGLNTTVVTSYEQDKRLCTRLPCAADTVVGPDPKHPSQGIDNPGYPKLTGGGAFFSGSIGLGVDL
ncbi:MAG TPA: hypothetical protein VHB21_22060 [Minicystis sp.]|nr:hypothetical protein [Minicystis sp.]